ncbi:hypothetical protein [Scytonema sp. NUACC26]|uniref:hypothetical protein n=1 Tax=Scytonema sp. NUACC26 TaxID=3140176 RepID=UPI0034DBD217
MVSARVEQNRVDSNLNRDFEQVVVPAIYKHLQTENYQEALEVVSNFSKTIANQDENDYLKNKYDSWKALILEKLGRYSEALPLYKSLAQVIGAEDTLFTYFQVDVARVLHKLGNYKEAILEIEKALADCKDSSISDKLTALNLYADILEECHETLNKRYQLLVENLADQLGIKVEDNRCLDSSYLSQLVKELSQKNHEANRRYSRMLIEVDGIEDDRQAENLIEQYISQESVSYYRHLAMKALDEILI